MSQNESIVVNGIKITKELTEALSEFHDAPIESQKNLIARTCMMMSAYNNPDIMPIEKDFYLILNRTYALLCSLNNSND